MAENVSQNVTRGNKVEKIGFGGTFTLLREGAFEEAKAFGTFSVTCMFVDSMRKKWT